MTKIAILLNKFGHDRNGNPVARHTVFSYADPKQELTSPTAELYQTRVRLQVGYSNNRDEAAGRALTRARVRNAKFLQREGDRATGEIWLIYTAD